MSATDARRCGRRARTVRGALCALATGLAAAAGAQPPPPLEPGVQFGAQRLPVPVTDGQISFAARRVALWSEGTPPAPTATRAVLTDDVRVALGTYRFEAARGVVWLSPLPASDPESGPGVYQVFAYFDHVGTPRSDAAVSIVAERLAVQGVIRTRSAPVIAADLRTGRTPEDAFTREGERKLAAYLARVAAGEPGGGGVDLAAVSDPESWQTIAPPPTSDRPPPEFDDAEQRLAAARERLAPSLRDEPIFAKDSVLTIAAGDATYAPPPPGREGGEAVLTVTGDERNPVSILVWTSSGEQTRQLTAERAVLFLESGPTPEQGLLPIGQVRGIYLEGDVYADDGRYFVRAPRIYYSPADDRALLIDTVFWTVDEQRGLPLYVRAKTIEQLGKNTYKATKAQLTNTAFFDPGLSIGVSSVTISKERRADEPERTIVDARDITLRAGGIPFFYFPRFRGDPALIPIRELRLEASSSRGWGIKTAWNAYTLFGVEQPPGQDMDLLLDEYFERGPAVGVDWTWRGPETRGGLLAYTLPYDAGRDLTSTGQTVERSGETRSIVLAEHEARLSDRWTLQAQGSYVSDATFVDAFFDSIARTRRELESSVAVRRNDDRSSLNIEAKDTFNDFIVNEYLLQSQGYSTSRVPEATYTRLADDVLPEAAPGLLTYSSQTRLGRVGFAFDEETAQDRGFTTVRQSNALFGILPGQSPADALRAQGYTSRLVTRFDTRHELSGQLNAGPVVLTPFATGRFTTWDHDFTAVSPDADERYRFWGSGGARVGTAVQRVDNSVESRLLDLHRIRHIVEPSVTVVSAGSTIDREDLPIYDESVESIAQGNMVRAGVNQTWQTFRGGPGRQRSVDVLKMDAELVFSDNDGPARSPIGRWIDYRPEASSLGDFFGFGAAWQVSEVVALAGETVYDFDSSQPDRTVIGGGIQHSPEFSTWADVRFVNSQDQTYATIGAEYQLTPKYGIDGWASYDTDRNDLQTLGIEIRRAMPNMWFGVSVGYNNINGDTSLGFVFRPRGLLGGGGGSGGGAGRTAFGVGAARSSLLGN